MEEINSVGILPHAQSVICQVYTTYIRSCDTLTMRAELESKLEMAENEEVQIRKELE